MSHRDMLGSLTRAFQGVPPGHRGLLIDAAHKLNGPGRDQVADRLARALRGEALPAQTEPADTIIRVDRRASYELPQFARCLAFPEYHGKGPASYSVCDLSLCVHAGHSRGERFIRMHQLYGCMRGELQRCLELSDGMAIQERGPAFYRRHFGEKRLFLLRSVADQLGHGYMIPYLQVSTIGVDMCWEMNQHELLGPECVVPAFNK